MHSLTPKNPERQERKYLSTTTAGVVGRRFVFFMSVINNSLSPRLDQWLHSRANT